jgi:RNA polymerase sigma-70 factor (ECF subfamily)
MWSLVEFESLPHRQFLTETRFRRFAYKGASVTTSDAELARQALAGSQEAFRALVARYASAAVNVAARLVHDRALAEDLAQEAFVRAFARLNTYDPARKFSSWFFQVLHNVSLDYLRRKRLDTVSLDTLQAGGYPGPSTAPSASPDAAAERSALGSALTAALARLRPEYREPIVLKYHQGLGVDEIAEILDLREGTVKTYLHRGRKELAEILAAAGWKP